MAKLRIEQLNEIRVNLDKVIKNTVSDLIKPYQKEITALQSETVKLSRSLEKLSSKIAQDITGKVKGRVRKAKKRFSKATLKKIAAARRKRWAEYRKKKKAKKEKSVGSVSKPAAVTA